MLFKQYFNTRYRPPIKLKGIGRLLFFHLRAFRLHYRLKRKFCKRVVRGIKRGENRLGSLTHQFEGRLDSVLYRLRWASSIREARQAVLGCRIYVNGRPRLSPSYVLRPGDKLVLVGGRSSLNRHIRKVWTWSHWKARPPYSRAPKGYIVNPYLYRKWRRTQNRLPWVRFLCYWGGCSPSFTVNYNILSAIYKPEGRRAPGPSGRKCYIGPGRAFWARLVPAFLDYE